jgi:molybdate transport system substrate-binding protein
MFLWRSLFLVSLVVASAGCASQLSQGTQPKVVTVFAAASLTEAFNSIAATFEAQNPGIQVNLNLAGSQALRLQIEQGAQADVLAFANQKHLQALVDQQLAYHPVNFAENEMVIVIPRANPAQIGSVADLAKPGIKLVLADKAVPAGQYAREVLDRLSHNPALGETFAMTVLENLVSEEDNIKLVAAKVQLGEADAGIVYVTDVTPQLLTVDIPPAHNIVASYPIAIATTSRSLELSEKFVDFVLSPQGQNLLVDHGFVSAQPKETRLE